MEDELRERPVELPVVERQRLGRPDPDVGAGDALAALLDERLRRIHAGDLVGADDVGEHARQRARAAADVEHALARARRRDARANSGASGLLYRPMKFS